MEHHIPACVSDRIAYCLVRLARLFADLFFGKRYGHRAVVIETIAAVPGMVGAFVLHLRSLRQISDDNGRIRSLLDEAENERMHLMVYQCVAHPSFLELVIIFLAQGTFLFSYFFIYIVSSRTAHRVVGYLEEEAIKSYTLYLAEIERGTQPDLPAPKIAIDYWHLNADATLRDVVIATRNDEVRHRDANHRYSDEFAAAR